MAMSCCRDSWISDLADELLGKILSLVPTKVVASTSVLSKRWRNVLGLVDTLCFDDSMIVYPNEEEAARGADRFVDFVDKTLALLSNSPPTKKFFVSIGNIHRYEDDHINQCVNRWMFTAMELGLLEIHLHASRGSVIGIETKLLTSNTLVKLTLSGSCFIEVKNVFFPALKSIYLLSVIFDHDNYSRLISGSPVLEELHIGDSDHPIQSPGCGTYVESASIKRLVVYTDFPDYQDFHQLVYCQAPSLVYLDYSSYVSEEYQIDDLDSLVEAKLSLRLWMPTNDYDFSDDDDDDGDDGYDSFDEQNTPNPPIFGNVTNLLAGITNITTLHLSPDSLEAFHFCCKSMPVFNNLVNLSIVSNKEKGWQVIPLLLKSCPNLQTLVIKGLVHRVTNTCGDACACIPKKLKRRKNKKRKIVNKEDVASCLWTCQVKVLEISEYGDSFQELKQMRHFLGKLGCLKTVKVGIDADTNISEFLRAKLLTLPRLSSKCIIQFI